MDNWHVIETELNPKELPYKETVFTIGNGYLSTRGSFEEGYPGEEALTLVHGVFDDVPIVNTELVNVPNWLNFSLTIDGERFRLNQGTVHAYRRDLDLRTGVLTRTVRWESPGGHIIDVEIERFASLADEHVLAIRWTLTSVNFAGKIVFRAGLPGHVDNAGLCHWDWVSQGAVDQRGAYLKVRTRATELDLVGACHLVLHGVEAPIYEYQDCYWAPSVVAIGRIKPEQTLVAEKTVTLYTARDSASPQIDALDSLAVTVAQGYDELRAENDAAWAKVWERSNITIEGDDEADLALRHSLFQLLIAAPRHDEHVSIAAKTLSGLGYRGHAFWDTEVFILPFFIYTQPEIARNLLMYRYHTLPGARRNAETAGFEGAMYAWESAATGDETTPTWVPGPDGNMVRIWCGDIELHIVSDVAHAVYQYWQVTGDDDFMLNYGAEILLDTARFWGSSVTWNAERERYELNDVIGPDEYHDHVDNNAYTNEMARWNLEEALAIYDWLRDRDAGKAAELVERLDLTTERLVHWEDVIAKLYVGYDPDTRLFEQFDGFFDLQDWDQADYEPRTQSMQVVLGIEPTQEYQILKQPDVLMLLYLLEDYYDPETLRANWDYYTPRTDLTYGSSLGPSIQAALAARLGDAERAYEHFIHAARTDLQNVRGNTAEGVHGAACGGLWQAALFGFAGLHLAEDGPAVAPNLPETWKRLSFRIYYRGAWFDFELESDKNL